MYRLTSETVTDPINGNHYTEFAYDAVGNRLQQFKDGVITTYSYNDNDHILSETEAGIQTSYVYDDNGNTLTKSIDGLIDTSYSYSKDNRLNDVTTPTSAISYTYDAGGIRQSQTVDGTTTHFLVDPNRSYAQVLEDQNHLFIPQTIYVYGDDLITQSNAQGIHTFGYDGLGSTRVLTDATGTVQNAYGYEAFGEIDYQLGTVENKYLFTGEQYDNNVGFYYLRARFYNPENGRFVNMDTYAGKIGEPSTLHKYLYTSNNPINLLDPSGNFSIGGLMAGIAIGGIVGNYATQAGAWVRLYQRLTFIKEKDPVAYIDFSGLNVGGYDNGFLKNLVMRQVKEYYKPYEIEIKSGKGSMLDRQTVFRNGMGYPDYGLNVLFFNRIYIDEIDDDLGDLRHPSKFAMAIANVVTHEIGHSLGLAHNTVNLGFMMDPGPATTFAELLQLQGELPFLPVNRNYLLSRLNK